MSILGPDALRLTLPQRLALIARSLLMHRQWYDLEAAGLMPLLRASCAPPPPPAPQPVKPAEAYEAVPKAERQAWIDAAKAGDVPALEGLLLAVSQY